MSAFERLRENAAAVAFVAAIVVLAAAAWAGMGPQIDRGFGVLVAGLKAVLMLEIPVLQMPLVVFLLFFGAIFFTVRFRFVNLRAFKHGLDVVRGQYDDPDDPGDVTHFQALSSALSATVGLGNIAGVAIAVSMGGPGAVFWMMVVALFGMSSKFAEATLGQMYRQVDTVGEMRGGPMVYLRDGLAKLGLERLGWVLSLLFAVLCIGTSIGAGNMFQANQSFAALSERVPWLGGSRAAGEVRLTADEPRAVDRPDHMVKFVAPPRALDDSATELGYRPAGDRLQIDEADWREAGDGRYTLALPVESIRPGLQYNVRPETVTEMEFADLGEHGRSIADWSQVGGISVSNAQSIRGAEPPRGWLYGLILAFLVGMVIIGGIKSIAKVAEKVVPVMCAFYIVGGLVVIAMNVDKLGWAAGVILSEAFNPRSAAVGSFMVVFVNGVRRAAFSSEAGIGSAPIAHSAAKTDEPVREGMVAMLGPFIDTIVVCFITGMVIVISGVWNDPQTAGLAGVTLTSAAFGTELWWFPWVLTIAVVLFAFSTMISWSYYGERCWTFLFGDEQAMAFRFIFVFFVLLGSVSSLDNVLGFGDYFLLAMSFPNIIGLVLLSDEIDGELRDYWERLKAGEFDSGQ